MKVERNLGYATMIPETNEEREVLAHLWEMLPMSQTGYFPYPGNALFVKNRIDDDRILIFLGK